MINLLIGFVSSVVLLIVFSLIEKKRIPYIGRIKYFIIIFIIFSSYLVSPLEKPYEWGIWLLFFYTVLDDIKSKTVFVPLYFLVVIVLFFLGHTMSDLLFAFVIFLIVLLFSKKTKETFFSIGDAYAILAITMWMGSKVFIIIFLSTSLASAILSFVSIFKKEKYYAFTPFLILSALIVKEEWYQNEILIASLLINFVFILIMVITRKMSNKS